MQLVLNEDQELLAKTALDFVREQSPISRVRELRDKDDALGFSPAMWKEMAELGWVGILIPEEHGGADMGLAELAVVMEALGRHLAPEPFLSTVLLGGGLLAEAGSAAQQAEWFPGIAAGERHVAVAYQEAQSRYDLAAVTTRAEATASGYRLRGDKVHVLDGMAADALIVSARTAGGDRDRDGVSLFLVPADAAGLERSRLQRIDSRGAAAVSFADVEVSADALLGEAGSGYAALERSVDRATVGLCAEMLGGMLQVFEDTVEHLKTREQFGVPIGSFQGLKHRAARLFMETELSRSAVMAAARAADADDTAALVSLAKARCSDAFAEIANEGVQMFGGVGMTDEYDIGFYMKRARVAEMTFGDSAWHRDRWASLRGY